MYTYKHTCNIAYMCVCASVRLRACTVAHRPTLAQRHM